MKTTGSTLNHMLRPKAASVFTGLPVSTLAKLRMAGRGPIFIKVGRVVLYDTDDLTEWLNRNRRKSTSCPAEVQ